MKIKKWLPAALIIAGIAVMAVGIWQITNAKIQTNDALNKAKQMLAEKKTITPKSNNKAQSQPAIQQKNVQNIQQPSKPAITGDTIGILEIPRIKAELPIVEGTDPNDLAKGVGHYKGSSLPSQHGQIVLSGHRDTVFRKLGELKIGDPLIVQIPNGSFTYKITHTKIVDENDTSIITLQKQYEELILTTCYPFYYIGNAPKRYIIYAKPA
jgi:sortase A